MAKPRSLRVAFLGNDRWSVPSLETLARSSHELVLVATRSPRPVRRGSGARPTPVAAAASRLGVPLAEVDSVTRGPGSEALAASGPEVLAVVAYGELLPAAVLGLPSVAPVNLHFSLLPLLRGASPVQTALIQGMPVTGVTTIVMDLGVDTGPILRRREERVLPEDDAGSLGNRLSRIGGEVLVQTIDDLSAGRAHPTPQDDAAATFAPKLGAADRRLEWTQPAEALANRVRALSPEPAALAPFRGEPLKVFRAEAVESTGEPGRVVSVGGDGFVVAAGTGGLQILEVAPPGRRRMTASEFVRGHRPTVGERLT